MTTLSFTRAQVLKLYCLGIRTYFKDRLNCIDFFLVIVSIVEIAFTYASTLMIMRALRLFRVVRLAPRLGVLRKLMGMLDSVIAPLPPSLSVSLHADKRPKSRHAVGSRSDSACWTVHFSHSKAG